MIELFKILKGIHDPSCVPQFDLVQLSEENIRTLDGQGRARREAARRRKSSGKSM